MKHLWAPWRINYILSEKDEECLFCRLSESENERDGLILLRNKKAMIVMNKYPYNNGHLMIAPVRHVGQLSFVAPDEWQELFSLLGAAESVLKREMNPDGLNVGINIGKVAGAGVEDHIHIHIVPRWLGDTNFMTVPGDIRVVPEALLATYDKLVVHFQNNLEIEP